MSSKTYEDSRGWRYRVMPGLGDDTFKGRYNKPGESGWHCMRQMPWRDRVEAAEVDLAAYAGTKGWRIIQEY